MKTAKEIEEKIEYFKRDLKEIKLDLNNGYINDEIYNNTVKRIEDEIKLLEWVLIQQWVREMNKMKEVAKALGYEVGEEFNIIFTTGKYSRYNPFKFT